MNNQYLQFLSGSVELMISGSLKEPFLNELAMNGIELRSVRRDGEHIRAYLPLRAVHQMRRIKRRYPVRVEFRRRKGLPFLFKRLMQYQGFALGIVLFFLLLFGAGQFIWGIHIEGASYKTRMQIEAALRKQNISVGQSLYELDRLEVIQQKLTNSIPNVTWIGVELRGTHMYLTAVEKKEARKPVPLGPRHLVSTKEATVVQLFIEKGQPLVGPSQRVQKGEILVSGMLGSEESPTLVSAKGIVYGETWYESDVSVPRRVVKSVRTGERETGYAIRWKDEWTIGLWNANERKEKNTITEEEVHMLSVMNKNFPLSFVRLRHDVLVDETEIVNERVARKRAEQSALKDVEKKIGKHGKIISIQFLNQNKTQSAYEYSFYIRAIENIARVKPIR
ncbi:MAG: sporulation protein YqfD [Bacilli bacterium]